MINALKPYYDILGVNTKSTKAEIKEAYREKCRELQANSESQDLLFKEQLRNLTLAFNILYFNGLAPEEHETVIKENRVDNLKDARSKYYELTFVGVIFICILTHLFFRLATSQINTLMMILMEIPVIILLGLFGYEIIYKNIKSINNLNRRIRNLKNDVE